MTRLGATVDLGLGVREIIAAGGRGRVVAVYRVAAYLRLPAGLYALTSLAAPPGPLHLRVAVLPVLRPGQPVRVAGGALTGPDWSVRLAAPTWIGPLPAPDSPASDPLAVDPLAADPCVPDPLALNLAVLARELGGRGPGLTPHGDDVLAGALLATRARRGPEVEVELAAVASSVRTTDVAAAYLGWAARGQCIEPAHQWLLAAADDDAAATSRAADRLSRVGASSGCGLLTGMAIGLGVQLTGGVSPNVHPERVLCRQSGCTCLSPTGDPRPTRHR